MLFNTHQDTGGKFKILLPSFLMGEYFWNFNAFNTHKTRLLSCFSLVYIKSMSHHHLMQKLSSKNFLCKYLSYNRNFDIRHLPPHHIVLFLRVFFNVNIQYKRQKIILFYIILNC